MTDLEMTRLCAEAMGLHPSPYGEDRLEVVTWHGPDGEHPTYRIYEPLNDDAQAMALVKKFVLHIEWLATKDWAVDYGSRANPQHIACNPDLSRAIVECVAKMQSAKTELKG